ncbi:MAG: hypothetical protein KBF98_06410, partial [Rhodoferax sp.]|nr:hypothetical protein [Rhodoferax sp.]
PVLPAQSTPFFVAFSVGVRVKSCIQAFHSTTPQRFDLMFIFQCCIAPVFFYSNMPLPLAEPGHAALVFIAFQKFP